MRCHVIKDSPNADGGDRRKISGARGEHRAATFMANRLAFFWRDDQVPEVPLVVAQYTFKTGVNPRRYSEQATYIAWNSPAGGEARMRGPSYSSMIEIDRGLRRPTWFVASRGCR